MPQHDDPRSAATPLPAEHLTCKETADEIKIGGPTFEYRVSRRSGGIAALKAWRGDRVVAELQGLAQIAIDDWPLLTETADVAVDVVRRDAGQVVVRVRGSWVDPQDGTRSLEGTLEHLFYSDGVLVTRAELIPIRDLPVHQSLRHTLTARGHFSHYLHKDTTHYDSDVPRDNPRLPDSGQTLGFRSTTSCLEVFSRQAALAMFTDLGGWHVAAPELETAAPRTCNVEMRTGPRWTLLSTSSVWVLAGTRLHVAGQAAVRVPRRTGDCPQPFAASSHGRPAHVRVDR